MIKVDNLYKIYTYKKKDLGLRGSLKNFVNNKRQEKIAVNKISFQIDDGEIVGFLGPNGAGKTTTLKMLSGIMFPTDGYAEVSGYVPWEGKNEFKRNISIVLGQKNQLWWDLPANESLYLNKCIYNISDNDYHKTLDELSELLDVKELLDVQVRNLSLGERMKMELLAALIHKPKVIFLDEPTIGLDMIAQKNIRDFLKYYNMQEKITIMLTSHYLEDIEALCQRTIVINNGSLVYDGKDIPLEESLEKLYKSR
jgi:ABC-2 type transport system ATP-binding protein